MHSKSTMNTLRYLFLSILLFIIPVVVAVANADEGDDYMSQLLKALTPTPTGWSNKTHFCKWNGVVCMSGRVSAITLPSSNLTGILPPDLDSLIDLAHIDLHNNSLTGQFPNLFGLSLLQTASFGHNKFTSIPEDCFRGLPHLRTLNLSNNLKLVPWLFPKNLRDSSLMQTLDLEATNILATLPSEMFDWFPSLHTVFLSHNNMTGTLPVSLGKSAVRYLRFNNQGGKMDRFSGSIDVISSMKFLSQAWLHNNAFTGPIPNLSNSKYLFDLQLHSNILTGLVIPSLFPLSTLKNISIDDNLLQGPVPVFPKNIKATWEDNNFCVGPCDPRVTILLQIFEAFGYPAYLSSEVNHACSEGSLFMCQSGKIVSVDLRNQSLTGTISMAFSNLTSLVNLNLGGNNLTGSIPHSLATLTQLRLLDVSDNNLSGRVPEFSSKVKLITTGNTLLGRGGGTSKTAGFRPLWIAGASMFSVGIVIFIVIICKRKRYSITVKRLIFRSTRKSIDYNVEDFIQTYNLSVPIKQYRYAEVKRMTNSFKDQLGRGGYGIVYKASLPDGRQVAVKMINESKGNGEEFINEVASISRTSHVNIVSLVGFCYGNKRALIYEFMPNGSLDKYIFKNGFPDAICNLDWNTMYQIAVGIARGLDYLHQGCISRILHLDIKPQNILLDEDFCPKISDFGLAQICRRNDSIVSILGTRGTIGYIAPEVFSRTFGAISHKSDVYSYGMLILEIIGGRKNYDTVGSCTSEMYFADWIYKDLQLSNNLVNGLAYSEEERDLIRKITMISLWCIQTNPSDRPSMNRVIEMLQGPLESIAYPPKPFLYSPEMLSLQTSYEYSNNLIGENSTTLLKNGSTKSNNFCKDTSENISVM
ncbi:receptor-like kinase TMK4 [Vicia villosa]|uniref:receptor-like kinase TMK4 n=1 Tax=Vicia villosa TaxID=3911 RepID=UPI00273A958B|nr:receptor-like kinase TMK4 [Vicia villosa]